jgi:amino acid transporter
MTDVATPEYTKLEADAIGVTEDTVIGMAASAPAASVGLTLAFLAAAVAYGSGPIIILTAIPMLIIANAYRRLNMWNANCGASFEWVGRAINPYLGFQTGWLMIAAYILGTISGVEVLAPTVLAAFGSSSSRTWANIGIDTALGLVMLVIAILGIKITARTQIGMALIEYTILIGFGIAGLIFVAGHGHGSSLRWPPSPTTGAVSSPGRGTWCRWACCHWGRRGSSAGSSSSRCCRRPRARTGPSWASSWWVWS